MDLKTLFGLTVLPAGFLGATILACLSRRVRDIFFVLLIWTSPLIERLDINYVSRAFYRGTSRGFEAALPDLFAVALLVSSILVPRRGESRAYWPASLGFFLLYFFYACFNVGMSEPRLFGLFELFRMFRGVVLVLAVAFYVRSDREVRLFVLGMALIIGYQGLLGLKQRYFEGLHRVPGTLIESNSLSVMICTTTPVLVAAVNASIPKWLKLFCAAAISLACVAEVLTISRAGITILGLVLVGTILFTASFKLRPRTIGIALLAVLGAAGLLGKSWKTLAARFHESTLDQEYGKHKNMGRGYYLRMAREIASSELFGVGLNNWSYWVSNKYGPKLGYKFVPYKGTDREPSDIVPPDSNVDEAQAAPAHNLGALTLGELGVPGLCLFSLVWLRWFQIGGSFLRPRSPDPRRRIAVGIFFGSWGMFLQCLTEWVFRHVPLFYIFHIMLGVLVSLYHLKRQENEALAAAAEPEGEASAEPVPGTMWQPSARRFRLALSTAVSLICPESIRARFNSVRRYWVQLCASPTS